MSTETITPTPVTARRARELAEQRLAFAFDAKTDALVRLQDVQLAEDPSADDVAAAMEDLRRVRDVYAEARAELERAVRAEVEQAAKRYRITYREPRP